MSANPFENVHPQIKVVLATSREKDAPSFGRGAAMLLKGVEETGSLNQSAKNLHMAYSKAWKMMKRIEDSLGIKLLERHGAAGSLVTPEGKALLEGFERLEKEIGEEADKAFARAFDAQ